MGRADVFSTFLTGAGGRPDSPPSCRALSATQCDRLCLCSRRTGAGAGPIRLPAAGRKSRKLVRPVEVGSGFGELWFVVSGLPSQGRPLTLSSLSALRTCQACSWRVRRFWRVRRPAAQAHQQRKPLRPAALASLRAGRSHMIAVFSS